MKNYLQLFSVLLTVGVLSLPASAQPFTSIYGFGNVTTTSGRTDPTPVPVVAGVNFSSFTAVGTGLSANPNASKRFSFTGWPLGATKGSNTFTGEIDPGRYYEITITPQPYYSMDLSSINFIVQRSATGVRQWSVRSSIDGFTTNLPAGIQPPNANLSVEAGDIFQIADRATTTAQSGCTITLPSVGFTGISTPVTFRFYGFNAESGSGTFSLNNVEILGTATIAPNAPNIILNPTSLTFASTPENTTAGILFYTVKGDNLSDPLVITTSAPYSVSDAINGTYSTSLSLPAADVLSPKNVYVKFNPAAIGSFEGTISNSSTNAITKVVNVSGQGIDPANLSFDFNNCTNNGEPASGWIAYSVKGQQVWACTSFGHNSTNGVNINGYSGGTVDNEDWLISPPLQISTMNLPVFRFWSRGEFSGPALRLLVSTDYSGTGDPGMATWTDLNAYFPPLTNTWTMTDGINLSAYKGPSKLYLAFKYISTEEEGSARWTLDDMDVTDRTTLLTVTPYTLNLGEASVGDHTSGLRVRLQSYGFGDLVVTAPAQYEVSAGSLSGYGPSLNIPMALAESGTSLFVRFVPLVKALNIPGKLRVTGTDLDSNVVILSATSYPKSETLDVGCYNLSFFGSNPTNNPTPEKIATQSANISSVLNRLNLDIVGVEEVSNDTAFANLVKTIPHGKAILSDRRSYSFNAPDPNYPPQKTGFIFDSSTVKLIDARSMFVNLYDSVLNGYTEKLPNYPGGNPQSFWASGRLPFMATFEVTIDGKTKQISVVDIHAKSASDVTSYNRRVYDAQVLYDSLKTYYANENVFIVGDYNDRVDGTIYGSPGATSPYAPFVNDKSTFSVLTYPLDSAGQVSFLSGSGMIDHVTITNPFLSFYIPGSVAIEDPRSYIADYNATTASDHFPVYTRFNLSGALPVNLTGFEAFKENGSVKLRWSTSQEKNSKEFVIEHSINGIDFQKIGTVAAAGNSDRINNYQFTDFHPRAGDNFYRLRFVDLDGNFEQSKIVRVNFSLPYNVKVTPNPASSFVTISITGSTEPLKIRISDMLGRIVLTQNILNPVTHLNISKLSKGFYSVRVFGKTFDNSFKLVKE